MRNFIGRHHDLDRLDRVWKAKKPRLLCLYGRRRVGKTELIRHFCQDKKVFFFEGLEGVETSGQVRHFLTQLGNQCEDPHLQNLNYSDWPPVFDLLTKYLESEKDVVLVLDELPWMAAGRKKIVSHLKYYWDKTWKNHSHLVVILCGSVTSWMVQNVVRSNALYGRVGESYLVEPLEPFEVAEYIGKKRGQREILEYLLCFGGIPRYLEEFDFNKSLQINIERTCFQRSGFFIEEVEKIFYSQFRGPDIYQRIVSFLLNGPATFEIIAKKVGLPSGGGLKRYLDHLTLAAMIQPMPFLKDFKMTKTNRYSLSDEFLRFHVSFIAPNISEIKDSRTGIHFEKSTRGKWSLFLGHAFERFCIKHRYLIADLLGFRKHVSDCGQSYDLKRDGYQYDLVYLRTDGTISVCEAKYKQQPIGPEIIGEMERKISHTLFPKNVTVEKILICNQEPSNALRESSYFHQILIADDMIKSKA